MNKTSSKEKSYIMCVLTGTLWGIAAGVMLLLISCAAGLALNDPEKYVPVLSLSSLFIASFFAGYGASRPRESGGAAIGAGAGVMFILVLVLLSLVFGEPLKLGLFAICAPVIVVTSLFAGITGCNRGKSTPKRKHKKIRF